MKNKILILIVLTLSVAVNSMSQTFLVDTAKLNSSYRELVGEPNTIERQKAFFDAFPNTWRDFITTYQYVSKEDYDLTMYWLAHKQIEALGVSTTLINDTLYCRKIVNIAIGGIYDADAPNYYKDLLHRVMWNKMDVMLYTISQLRKGHQMQFWQFYWSSNVKSKSLETEFYRLSGINTGTYPEEIKTMKTAFDYFYDGVNIDGGYLQLHAQEAQEKKSMQKFIEENNIPKLKYEKFWDILEKNYISYHPKEDWKVISDTLAYVFDNDTCPMQNKMFKKNGVLAHRDGKCRVAVSPAFEPMGDKKLPIPYKLEIAKEYIFSRIGNGFDFGKPYRSLTKQELKDVEMLVTYYPADTAKAIFNGVSLFVYPLNFKGEYCQNMYRYGRGVVVMGIYNVPLYLYFFMTDESIADFDRYLSELKGMFTFQDIAI